MAAEAQGERRRALSRLDERDLPVSLERLVLASIDSIWAKCPPEDRAILHPIGSWLLHERASLEEIRRKHGVKSGSHLTVRPPPGFRDTHPVCATLLEYRRSKAGFEGLDRLLSIAVAAALEASTDADRRRINGLARNIRGALEDQNSALRLILQQPGSLSKMVREVERQLDGGAGILHRDFSKAWRDWIRDRVTRWFNEDPEALRLPFRPTALIPDLDGSEAQIGGCEASDPDDQMAVALAMTELVHPDREAPAEATTAKAWSRGLIRGSQGDLSLPSDQLAPAELVLELSTAAIDAARSALARDEPLDAEPPIALALALATGAREMDLGHLTWGEKADGRMAVIDPSHPRMHRSIRRPPNAVRPGCALSDWLTGTTEELSWPLPPSLHRLLIGIRETGEPGLGTPVLPLLSLGASRRYRLRDVCPATPRFTH